MPENKETAPDQLEKNEIVDFIGTPPGWLLKSGITIISIVVVILISVSGFIKYPDKFISQGIMTSETPPVELVVKEGGIVGSIFKRTNDYVEQGDTLLYIENLCNLEDLHQLRRLLKEVDQARSPAELQNILFPKGLKLGELQNQYSRLELTFEELVSTQQQASPFLQIITIKEELHNTKKLENILAREKDLDQRELLLAEKDFLRTKKLFEGRIISEQDYDKATSSYLEVQKQHEISGSRLIQNKIRQNELVLQIEKVGEDHRITVNTIYMRLNELVSNLHEGIDLWASKSFIKAERAGRFIKSTGLHEKMTVTTGQAVASIIPGGKDSKKFIKAFADGKGIGKIKEGDRVIVKVDGFPYKEFGVIESMVNGISFLPEKDKEGNQVYELTIPLPDTIVTNYGLSIPYKPNTGIISEVITEDKSILQRLFSQFLNLIKNN